MLWRQVANIMATKDDDCDVFDSWENIEDTDILEQKLKAMLPKKEPEMERNSCNTSAVNVILLGDDALRTQYVPPEPTVKILKRPTKSGPAVNGDTKPKVPIKTLKQREQEYAEARLRILGEAHCPNDKEDRVCSIQNKVYSGNRNEQGPLVRLPRGPDGSKGFHLRR